MSLFFLYLKYCSPVIFTYSACSPSLPSYNFTIVISSDTVNPFSAPPTTTLIVIVLLLFQIVLLCANV